MLQSMPGKTGPAIAGHPLPRITTTRDNLDTLLSPDKSVRFCPGAQGGSEWNGPAYNPTLNIVFVNATDWCTSVKLPIQIHCGSAGNAVDGFCRPKAPFGKQDPKEMWVAGSPPLTQTPGLNAGVPLFRAASRCCDATAAGLSSPVIYLATCSPSMPRPRNPVARSCR